MHVAFLHPAVLFSDGTERLVASVRAAVAAGSRVSVLTAGGTRLDALTQAGAEVFGAELPASRWAGFFAARRTRERLAEMTPDLLHVTHEELAELAASLVESLRIPYVVELTAPLAEPLPLDSTWNRAVIVPCGTFVENAVNRGRVPRATLRVIEHGPPLERTWTTRPFAGVSVPVVANLGTLDENRGTLTLIEAARQLKDAGRKLRCLVLGEGPAEDATRRRARELGLSGLVTVACPTLPDLSAVLGKVDLHVACVRGGSPGWCAVQALGLGIPSVFSAVNCAFPLVEDRRNGLLVERDSPEKLAEALVTMLDNRPAAVSMGRAARQGLRARGIDRKYAEEVVGVHRAATTGARV